jgi:hypothetical protein
MSSHPQIASADQSLRIDDLRELQRKAREIYRHARRDLAAFQQRDGTFSTSPPPKSDKIHITTTCTALMALVAAQEIELVCPPIDTEKSLPTVFKRVVEYEWKSEGLAADNAFSVAFVLRAAGFLVKANKVEPKAVLKLSHKRKSLEEIAKNLLTNACSKGFASAFGVGAYPPNAAIVYWYVDGIDSLAINIDKEGWRALIGWATREFARQMTRVASDDDASMDPVSMAMAACLVCRLKKIISKQESPDELVRLLPSKTEVNTAVALLFKHQRLSGIWPKYFPMFHFLTAGANYCFTFEMLEALVSEMDPTEIFNLRGVVTGLNNAASWCVVNRLQYRADGREYFGWNSGGSIETLLASKPESWATATVHWFLHKLDDALAEAIKYLVLQKYRVIRPTERDSHSWEKLADADVDFADSKSSVKTELEEQFISPLSKITGNVRIKIDTRRSALLFGPPGTAKTTLVRELARSIGWPCVEIRPSHFLSRGLDNIYVVADEIFDDLMDLSRAIIFFDEMDALVQSRRDGLLDTTRQFLTTSMLPKLAGLHDEGSSVFFVATNYRATFDEAITRPGRFDLLLFVGPPSWHEKVRVVDQIVYSTALGGPLKRSTSKEEKAATEKVIAKLRKKLEEWAGVSDLREKLERFTYGETRGLVEELLKDTKEQSLAAAVGKLDKEAFVKAVNDWSNKYIILRDVAGAKEKQNDTFANYRIDQSASRRQ